eukprot:scaffold24390_cov107-Isochrysis_galbana.AAC.2
MIVPIEIRRRVRRPGAPRKRGSRCYIFGRGQSRAGAGAGGFGSAGRGAACLCKAGVTAHGGVRRRLCNKTFIYLGKRQPFSGNPYSESCYHLAQLPTASALEQSSTVCPKFAISAPPLRTSSR